MNMRHLFFLALAGLTALVGCGGGDKPVVARLVFTQQPVGTTAGASLAAIQVTAQDSTGKVVEQDGTVQLVLAAGPAGATLAPVEAQLDDGVATFEGLKLTKAGTGYAFDASMGSFTARSDAFAIAAGAPGKLVVTAEPAEESVAGEAIAPAIQVVVRDAYDNAVASPGGEVNVSLVGEGATLSGTLSARVSQGVATFADLSVDKVGAYNLQFHFGDKVTAQSRQLKIKPGARTALAFTVQPSAVVAGVNIAPAVAVSIVDKKGNVVPDATDTITLALADNPGGATLNGTLTAAAVSGVATFGNLSLKKAAGGYTLQASSGSLTAVKSGAFAVTAAAPAKLAFGQQPANGTAGQALNPAVTVRLLDVFDNLTAGTDEVTLALGSNPGNDTLSGTTQVAAVAGVASFPGLSLKKAASGYTLVASAGSFASSTSSGFDIDPAAAASLVFVSQPANTTAGLKVATVTVALEDAFGNRATTSTRSVFVELNGGAALLGTKTVDTVAGVASFSDLIVQKAGTGYTLRAFVTDSPALTEAASSAFDISAAAAAKLAFAQQPTDVVAGKAIAPAVTVAVQDAFGNTVGSTASITLALKANPGGSTLSGTKTVSAVGGIATFGDLSLQKAEEGYTLQASSGALTVATSGGFAVTAAAPAKLIFAQQPANGTAGEALGTVSVKQVDAFDNVTTGTDEVTLAVGNNPGDDTLSGTTQVAAVAGTATFTGLSLKKAATGYTLMASSGSLTGSTSSSFNIVPAAPMALVFASQPTDTTAGVKVAKVNVAIEDAFGNKATNASTRSIAVELKTTTEGASLLGTQTVDTVAGVASFSDLIIQKAATGYSLRAYVTDAPALTEAVSSVFDITAAAGAKLVFAQQPTDVVAGKAIAPAVSVNVLDAFGNQATSTASITVALASNPGGSTLSGTKTVSAVAGVATFGDLSLQKAAGGYTLKVSSGTLTTATSDAFAVMAAAPAKLAFAQQPANGTAGEVLSPAVTVNLLDMFDNATAGTDDVTLALGSNPGGDSLSGTTTVAAVAGVATFSNVKLQKAATGYTLTASSGTLASDTSTSFDIAPGAVASLTFVTQPVSTTAGVTLAPVSLSLQDAFGNKATNSTKTISVELKSATLLGTLTVNPVAGDVSFSDLVIQKAGTGYTLRAYVTDASTVEAVSTAFNITAAAGAKLAFAQQPTDVVAGKPIAPAVTVAVQDAFGNTASSTASITLTLKTNPGSSTFSGTRTVSAVGGIATFSTLSLNKAGTGYSLNAAATGLTAGVSSTFAVAPSTPTLLIFRAEPASTTAGTTLAVTKVEAQDAFANIATTSTISVNLALANNTAGAVLEGTTSVALVNGTATFDALTVKRVGKNLSLVATATGVTRGAVGTPFNVSAGPAAKLAFTTQPGRGLTGVPLAPAPVLAVQDAYGNPTAYNGPVTVSLGNNPTGANLGGMTTVNAKAGVASFFVNVDTEGTGYTLVAAGDTFSGVQSNPFDVATRTVGLVYTNPAGGKVSLQRNPAASTDTRVVLDLVAMENLTGYGVGFNLPVDTSRALLNPAGLMAGGILNPGSNPAAVMAVLPTSGPMAGVLSSAQSQKASGEGSVTTDTFIPAGSVLYSVQIDLAGSATPGVVFDGTTLPAAFNGALRDRQGNNVVSRNEFAIGRLEIQ
ncbi:beta strand repeat-containing protein [Archangium sp.]|uniref:beta strand repeat-containing protein n=1 Tax=Archangium sp. TaxID=1872627 RepID=UPI00389B1B39